MEPWQGILLFVIGNIAGFLNVMAGGGSSLTLPALIFMGLDSALANGTNRVGIFVQSIFAIQGFRQNHFAEPAASLKLSLLTLPGAVLGAFLAVRIEDVWFQRILAVVLIGILLSLLFPLSTVAAGATVSGPRRWFGYVCLLGIGFYGGFIQVGVGFLIMGVLFHVLQLDLIRVNMHKVFITFIYTIPALGIFIWHDKVNWGLGLTLALGNASGAWIAAHTAVKGGEAFIRKILVVTILLIALKLFGLF